MGKRNESLVDRFMKKVVKTDSCWLWTGGIDKGYGVTTLLGKAIKAHRASYRLFKGDPHRYLLHHLCENKRCVNPDHLVKVTRSLHSSIHLSKELERQIA